MPFPDVGIEKEAEYLEKQASREIKVKNYEKAISLLSNARDINLKLGFIGKVRMIEKKIAQVNNIIKRTISKLDRERKKLESKGKELLEKAKNSFVAKEFDKSLRFYKDAYFTCEKLNDDKQCQFIVKQLEIINESQKKSQIIKELGTKKEPIKSPIIRRKILTPINRKEKDGKRQSRLINKKKSEREKELELARIQRAQILRKVEETYRETELKQKEIGAPIKKSETKTEDLRERKKKMKELAEKRKRNELLIKKVEKILEKGKSSVDNKKFDEAKLHYKESIEIFSGLGWNNQVELLKEELKNIDKYKVEFQYKLKQASLKREENQKQFQKRVNELLAKKKEEKLALFDQMKEITPEIKRQIEKVKMIINKAEREEKANQYKRALARYEHALNVYKLFPKNNIEFSQEIIKLEKRISILKNKM